MDKRIRKLQSVVVDVVKTDEFREDEMGNRWRKCIFTVKLVGFSKRTPGERMPDELKEAEVKVVRWCCFDWHYRMGVRITLTPEETELVLKGKLDLAS
jgi:hypothetical protein|uniref:Uncharacterized protein n=1 Tax=Thermofilum pendens TaxID=2269 RepID=A0A7C4BB97_THEPE